jgi:hypothetical protein
MRTIGPKLDKRHGQEGAEEHTHHGSTENNRFYSWTRGGNLALPGIFWENQTP